jgi:hypothetical protein
MNEDFLFYSLFKNEMGGEFQNRMEHIVNLIYRFSEEISGNGEVFSRAIKRGEATELISTETRVFQLNMN